MPLHRIPNALFIALLCHSLAYGQTYEISPAKFNSSEADFGGTFKEETFIFSSSRQKTAITYNEDTIHTFFTDLYQTRLNNQGQWQTPTPISGRVNTIMNEAQCTISADGKTMYYTGNLKNALSKKKEKSEKYELGIFRATLYNKEWVDDGEFAFNSLKSDYSCGHPCLAQGDSLLYFSCNQPGGFGGSDIYFCTWENNAWSKPVNLGNEINTKGNEFFPFVNEYGVLYFTSDSRDDSEGLDIYSCYIADGAYVNPQRLPEPVNSAFDDFAYAEKTGSNKGCISSNRDGDNDDIYLFTKYENNYNHCLTNNEPIFCYLISDVNYPRIDSLPYVYEWQFSDGVTQNGSSVKHCFPDYGIYDIALNIRDTLTKNLVLVASKNEVHISRPTEPYFNVPHYCNLQQPIVAKLELPLQAGIDTTQITWILGDLEIGRGKQLIYQPTETGEFQLACRLKTKATKKSSSKKICIEQLISIQADSLSAPKQIYQPLIISSPDQISTETGEQLLPKYYLSVRRTASKLDIDDPSIKSVPYAVREMTNHEDYIYVLEEHTDLSMALQDFQKYDAQGIDVELIKCLTISSLYEPTPDADRFAVNTPTNVDIASKPPTMQTVQIDPQQDFDRQVRYTATVMKIEPDLNLQIICYYNSDQTAEQAKAKALKIKEHLTDLSVQSSLITIVTELNNDIAPNKQIKLILQYSNHAQNNE